MPKVSIVVPVYNAAPYLPFCVESILGQQYKNFELILIDDGSQDDSLTICHSYAKKDNRIIVASQLNKGVSAARNLGLSISQGEWITFIDSDDWIEHDFLNVLIDTLSGNTYDWITSGLMYRFSNKSYKREGLRPEGFCDFSKEYDFRLFATQKFITSPCAKLYKNQIIKSSILKFDVKLSYAEDRDFNIEYLKHCKNGFITDYVGYNYRRDLPESLSVLKKGNIFESDIKHWNKLYSEFHKREFLGLESRKYLIHRLYFFLSDFLSISKISKNELQYVEQNVKWTFFKKNLKLIEANFIEKLLISHKKYNIYYYLKSFKKRLKK